MLSILGVVKDSRKEKKDSEFLKYISSKGGIVFKDRYIKKGDGYEASIIVYGFPKRNNDFWLSNLLTSSESIVTFDITNANKKDLLYNLNQALSEHESRYIRDKKVTNTRTAQNKYLELTELYDEIYDGEIVKELLVRLYISARTIPELENKISENLIELESAGFKATLHQNLLEDDFKALSRPLSQQKDKATIPLFTKEITSSSLAGGIHTHYTKLHDPKGCYYGHSLFSDGEVVFDPFHSDRNRKFYNSIVLGKMGSGKSTLLKKMALSEIAKGSKVRIFDASGEFYNLAEDFEGLYISLDGRDNRINPLQVYATSVEIDKSQEDNDRISYQNHMAKLEVFFNYLLPDLTSPERAELTGFLHDYYKFRGLITEDKYEGVCDHDPARYGTLSDFIRFLSSSREVEETELKKERAESLKLNIGKILINYKNIFDGISSFNISDNDLVVFNVKGIANLPKEINEAILFNVLNTLWNEMLTNVHFGSSINIAEEESKSYLLVIDESHRLINSASPDSTIRFYENFMREARKYQSGIVLASHLLDDFGASASSKMNKLFQLTQYKFIFKQDISSKKTFEEVFSKELRSADIEMLPVLEVGECIMSISGYTNIAFKVSLGFEEERKYLVTGGK